MRPSDVLAQHTPTPLDGGLACTCHEWQCTRFPGGVDTTAWGFAVHQIEMLQDAGWDLVRQPDGDGS